MLKSEVAAEDTALCVDISLGFLPKRRARSAQFRLQSVHSIDVAERRRGRRRERERRGGSVLCLVIGDLLLSEPV
jgi:hypothetical protein